MAKKKKTDSPDKEEQHGTEENQDTSDKYHMAELLQQFMVNDDPDNVAQRELRKEFPILAVLACVRIACEGALKFIEALADADNGKQAFEAFEDYLCKEGVGRLGDLFDTACDLEYAWRFAQTDNDGKIYVPIPPTDDPSSTSQTATVVSVLQTDDDPQTIH